MKVSDPTSIPPEHWRPGVETRMVVSARNGAAQLCVFEQWVAPGAAKIICSKCRPAKIRFVLSGPSPISGVSMSLTLHFHPLSSFCWKALVALYENDIPFTPKLVDLGNPAERAALLKLWPIGKFPVLQDDARSESVPESSVIIEYLDRHYPGRTRFIPEDSGRALQ